MTDHIARNCPEEKRQLTDETETQPWERYKTTDEIPPSQSVSATRRFASNRRGSGSAKLQRSHGSWTRT